MTQRKPSGDDTGRNEQAKTPGPDPADQAQADPISQSRDDPQGSPSSGESAVASNYGGLRSTQRADDAPPEPYGGSGDYLHIDAHEQRDRDQAEPREASERQERAASRGKRSQGPPTAGRRPLKRA